MKRHIPLLMLALFVVLSPAAQATKGVALYSPYTWATSMSACSQATQVTAFFAALDEGGWQGNYVAYWNTSLSDSPVGTAENLVVDTQSCNYKNYFHTGHANASLLETEYFATAGKRNDQIAYYLNTLHWDASYLAVRTLGSAYAIVFKGAGMQSLISPYQDDRASVVVSGCHSSGLSAYMLSSLSDNGQTFVGYPSNVAASVACNNMNYLTQCLSCQLYDPDNYSLIDNSFGDAVPYLAGMELQGSSGNRLWNSKTCKNWAARFLGKWQFDGAVHWAVSGEDTNSRYIIRAFDSWGQLSKPDAVAVVRGRGSDGTGVVRVYSFTVDRDAPVWEILEFDDWGRKTTSEYFVPGGRPANWERIVALDEHAFEAPGQSGPTEVYELTADGEFVPFRTSGSTGYEKDGADECTNCGDVVVVSSQPNLLGPTAAQAAAWPNENNYMNQVKSYLVASNNPDVVRGVLATVAGTNASWNEQHPGQRHYPVDDPGPILEIAGNETIVRFQTYPEDEMESCQQPICRSYNMLGDYDGGGYGDIDCPVAVLPAETLAQLQSLLAAANERNAGQYTRADGRAVFFAGNRYGSGIDPSIVQGLDSIENSYLASGHPSLGIHAESQFDPLDYQGMKNLGTQQINQGVRDVWFQGVSTTVADWTLFLSGAHEGTDFTTRQRIVVFGPSCETGAMWWGDFWGTPVLPMLMFNDLSRTVCVGAFLHLTGAYAEGHQRARQLEFGAVAGAPPRRTYATANWLAAREMALEDITYARGMTYFGAYVMLPANDMPADVVENLPLGPSSHFWTSQSGSTMKVHLELASPELVQFSCFDVAGREVASLASGPMTAGSHEFQLQPRGGSGIYFLRLGTPAGVTSRKMVYLK